MQHQTDSSSLALPRRVTRSRLLRFILTAVLIFSWPVTVQACFWDYDTLKEERRRFPTALELITGKFARHSKEFYEWRIQDRLNKLQSDPTSLAWHNDLAVAYEKTGQHAKAIELMLEKEKRSPGEYETASNLGTFYILAGDFESGLPYIDKALAINPDAHFGREKYQKWLVEYALSKRTGKQLKFPLRTGSFKGQGMNFRHFLEEKSGQHWLSVEEIQAAVKGILGMLRFANHENPLLLEALGDLLSGDHDRMEDKDAKRLAARCYLKASAVVQDEDSKQAYLENACGALLWQSRSPPESSDQLELSELQADFATELNEADEWYATLKQKELNWIREGRDVDAEFDRLMDLEMRQEEAATSEPKSRLSFTIASSSALVIVIFSLIAIRKTRSHVSPHDSQDHTI
jgi:tetratricopeptide (TPR) repeat protein